MTYEFHTNEGHSVEWGIDWYSGGNPQLAGITEQERAEAESAVSPLIRELWADGLPATEEEYSARQARAEEAVERVLRGGRDIEIYNDRWEGFCLWVRVNGLRWEMEEDEEETGETEAEKTEATVEEQVYDAIFYVIQREILSMPDDATESDRYFRSGVLKGICIGFDAASAALNCPEGRAAARKTVEIIAKALNLSRQAAGK